jgi:hypothetical protein
MKTTAAILLLYTTAAMDAADLHWSVAGKAAGKHHDEQGEPSCSLGLAGIGQTNTTAGATSYTLATSNQPPANALMLVSVVNTHATAPTIPTLTGHGQLWVMIATTNGGGGIWRLSLFRALTNNTPTSAAVVASFGATTQTGCAMRGLYLTNTLTTGTNGSGAIAQSVMTTNNTTNPTITLGALNGDTNAVLACFVNNVNGFGATSIDGGWTQDIQNGWNTPATGQLNIYATGTSDNTPSITDGAQAWGCIAVEIQKACP